MAYLTTPSAQLAVSGGKPVRPPTRRWPTWPKPAPEAESLLREVLHSGRWAISSPEGSELFERRFAREFASYLGVRHCVPVDHGSSALVVAMEVLDLQHGDVVLVPALTWTACATAALRAGLVPLLVDIDPVSGCVTPECLDVDVEARAVIAVHWACRMADIPALSAAAAAKGMTVIEDAAQAHGGEWRGRQAGSMGRLGCFSFQNGKALTAGEGGAVVTDDSELAPRLEELRADSRRYRHTPSPSGGLDLEETATIQGANHCMSEFNAALLCAQLTVLDHEVGVRTRNWRKLGELLAGVPGVRLLEPAAEQTKMAMYEATIVFDELPGGMDVDDVADALSAELGRRFYVTDTPLHRSPLLAPWTKPALAPLAKRFVDLHAGRSYPHADHWANHCVQTHHSAFLGEERDMHDIAEAIIKVTTTHRPPSA
ncbi:3-amino-5-hydroxybenzoate synthase [Nonomuraea antimicrobica]|uniref:3-amino-5-hydroxybenzoate synthase n=1 Tax=Nonomuraea antimicrobica TaxID=561173 RepID=A0ABP7BHZ4_9ACTN